MHLNYLKVAEECKRVLKKNGLLIFLEPLNDNPLIFIYRKLFSKFKKTRPVYLKYQDLIKVSKYFNQFRLKGFYLISFLSLFLRDTSLYKPISKLFKRIETILMRVVPMLERYCWLNVSVYKK
jgi:SAM-dependent methyltransferase